MSELDKQVESENWTPGTPDPTFFSLLGAALDGSDALKKWSPKSTK